MTKENVKGVYSAIDAEAYKKIKIMAVQKDVTMPEMVQMILEKSVANKKFESVKINDVDLEG